MGVDGKMYRLFSWEVSASPNTALKKAIRIAIEYGADRVIVETDQGGDLWETEYREAVEEIEQEYIDADEVPPRMPAFDDAKAGSGHGPKVHRSQKMLRSYETGRIIHVTGTHRVLERALYRFPDTEPLDLADAAYWGWYDLIGEQRGVSVGMTTF